MATICCASTSSGLRGTTVGSMAPSCMRRATTAHSSRSPRYLGKMPPRWTLARPGGRRGRCAAARARPTAATPPARPGPPHPCRCPARARGGDEAGQPARLEQRPRSPGAARARASRGGRAHQRPRPRQLVEPLSASRSASAPAVDEDDRASGARGPARAAAGGSPARCCAGRPRRRGRGPVLDRSARPGSAMSSTGTSTAQIERLAARRRRRCDRHVAAAGRRRRGTRHLLQRPLRRRQADALRRSRSRQRRQPLQRQRQVRAALGRRQRVDLVDDDPTRRRRSVSRACEVSIR